MGVEHTKPTVLHDECCYVLKQVTSTIQNPVHRNDQFLERTTQFGLHFEKFIFDFGDSFCQVRANLLNGYRIGL